MKGILQPEQAFRHFTYDRYAPTPEIRGVIEHYWIVRWEIADPFDAETLPHPNVNAVLESEGARVWGVWTRKFSRRLAGRGHAFGTKFQPGGFRTYLGRAVSTITDRVIAMASCLEGAEQLRDVVLAAADDATRVQLADAFFRARLSAPDPVVGLVTRAVLAIQSDRSILRVDALAQRLEISVRMLQHHFREYVGVSPKWVIRRTRLQEAAQRMADGVEMDWAAFARELGYFDQAHFTKDFRAQVGLTPARFARLQANR